MQVAEPFKLDQIFLKLGGLARVALAVSGGSDSMAMLRMMHAWALAKDHHPEIIVLTVDHGLREAAAGEAKQVAQWCKAIGMSHQILQWQHEGVKSGIQAKARVARYDLMTAWCAAHDVPALLTAHTADDQAETVAMRQSRTTSLKSLAGIWPERDWQGIQVLRPLLKLRRRDLKDYLTDVGQDWIDDPSNYDRQFERVRVRFELGDEVEMLVDQAEAALAHVKIAEKDAIAWWQADVFVNEFGFAAIRRRAFGVVSKAVLDVIIVRCLAMFGGGGHAELAERQRLADWLIAAGNGRRVLAGVMIAKQKDLILVGREPGRIAAETVVIPATGKIVWDNRFEFKGPAGAEVVPVAKLKGIMRHRGIPAFVQAGLPAIILNGQIWSIPLLEIGQPVEIKFLQH